MKKIECIISDWAGTAVDYGCFAPVAAFIESFKAVGLTVTAEETRSFMGLTKIEEIRKLFAIDHVAEELKKKNGRESNENDIMLCYDMFRNYLITTLADYAKPLPGVVEAFAALRDMGVKIGSTTGYTREMMDVVEPAAAAFGYKTDCCVTSDGLPGGRPLPYMIYKNMCELNVPQLCSVVKYGDTIADIKEGVNAGVWSVGVILGSNEMGLTVEDVAKMTDNCLKKRMNDVRYKMYAAGADYVVDSVEELPLLVEAINARMNK